MFEQLVKKADKEARENIYNRKGKIEVTADIADYQPTELSKVFAMIGFVPNHIDCVTRFDITTFYGRSEQFDPVEVGAKIPQYKVNVTVNEKKEIVSATLSKAPY